LVGLSPFGWRAMGRWDDGGGSFSRRLVNSLRFSISIAFIVFWVGTTRVFFFGGSSSSLSEESLAGRREGGSGGAASRGYSEEFFKKQVIY